MGKLANVSTRIWLDEFDLSGVLNTFDHSLQQELAAVTAFSDTGPRRVVGNYDYRFAVQGFFDGDQNAFDQQAFVDLRTDEDHYLSLLPGANAEGEVHGRLAVVRLVAQPRAGQLGGAVLLSFDAEGSGGLSRATVLANATVTGAGNRTGRNMGATTSGKVFAVHFHVFSFSGTNITLKVQESQDDGGADAYADVSGLTSGALTGVGVVRATTSAATEAWKRVNISGTFTSAAIGVVAGVVAGT